MRRFALALIFLSLMSLGIFYTRHLFLTAQDRPAPGMPSTPAVRQTPSGFIMVSRVIDGDTIEATIHDKLEKIRLIGIDTPETVDPRRPVQCFGREASEHLKKLIEGE